MTISELIEALEKIKNEKGDLIIRRLNYSDEGDLGVYEDVKEAEFITDKDEPQTSVNPYANGFVVID